MSKSLTKIACLSTALVVFSASSAFAANSDLLDSQDAASNDMEFITSVTNQLADEAFAAIAMSDTKYLTDVTTLLGNQALSIIESSAQVEENLEIAVR